ncbi:putative mitochondrial heat shock 70 protein-like protein [Leptomonas pyrrhocoris]|uniref:Putative mitochondrial heat shock 70 protein-like protein n=1 Tax=Leptomonas pyrrhocoris TaxID=157538 RepID=A0A0M9GB86_LEPPY|nr:putative mitochondrial heat shock 70 protein-like protein [Leptomonas pyrrhocoris]KPA86830.1 putative mitochondrial heat shock 70 protein-like protein [Leptomonas pyrrhocoris]|eukprot:XP_015665269.1 putative mitochondrial heat shock 70 protein-like protein [Leptomonas pyrrhocoris]
MRRQLFRRSAVLLQMGMGGGAGGMSSSNTPIRPSQTVSYTNAIHVEAERRRKMEEDTRSRYYVVKEDIREKRGTGRMIGIDLGTTNSCVCYIDNATKRPKIIPSPTGSWVFPTAITFDKNHEIRMFGEEARACARTSASATLCSGKRLIGRSFGELGRVQSDLNKTNILTVNEKGEVAVEIMGRTYTVVHIIAMFLRYLKSEAEKFLGEEVQLAVVSVPAYFTPQQKVATEDAALCAGFDVLEIIDEPSAACLASTVLEQLRRDANEQTTEEQRPVKAAASAAASSSVKKDAADTLETASAPSDAPSKRYIRSLVFDLGGGTLDCAVMEHDCYRQKFNLVATHGDPMLGGNDWDTVLSQHFAKQFERKWHVPIEEEEGNVGQGVAAFRNLTLEAEKAKIHFTHSTETYYGYNRAFHFSQKLRDIVPLEATLTHEEYVSLTRPLRVRCLQCVEKLFEHTGFTAADIDRILLVGAMTRDPPIRHMLQEYFGKKVAQEDTCPADYAVALGAGIRGGMLQGSFPELTANTRFVSGTVQSLREGGGVLRQLWRSVRRLTSTANPNAIGTRWRGRAKGLVDEEIANYAKELVEFEAACARRLLLERAESEANFVMRRVSADSNRKQGMQERRIMQLSEQLKFWQYMVHNFHDHEEELLRVVRQLQVALDELDGLAADNVQGITNQGTIDFSKTVAKTLRSMSGKGTTAAEEGEEDEEEGERAGVTRAKASSAETQEPSPLSSSSSNSPPPKILRRRAPLPAAAAAAQSLVEAGHPALLNADIEVAESARNSFLQAQVEERAWHEPPAPPGEAGSWTEVKAAVDAGEVVGAPVPWKDLLRPMTMTEMQEMLEKYYAIDAPPTPEHAAKRDEATDLQSMTIVRGAVDMAAIEAGLARHEQDVAAAAKEEERSTKEHNRELSARMYR